MTQAAARTARARSYDQHACRLARSALAGDRADEVPGWLSERRRAGTFEVRRIPFDRLQKWAFEPDTGNLVHDTGRFFSVEGLSVREDDGPVWSQPVINQPETGILGILVKDIGGVPHFLMQAKMEPGNIGLFQLGPTVQATRSNYTGVHRGRATRYVEYFVRPRRGTVLTDVLQSEQGDSFLRKRNRNMVVEITGDIEEHDDYRWLTLGEIHRLLAVDNLVNMDARTVLSSLPFPPADGDDATAPHTDTELLSWLAGLKTRREREVKRIPLSEVRDWRRTPEEIAHVRGRHLRVLAVSVLAGNREVTSWTQPLLAAQRQGLAAFVIRWSGGAPQVLVQGLSQPGTFDVTELAPTVQCVTDGCTDLPQPPPFLDYVLSAPADRVRYSAVLSEEGGRFHERANRYLIVEADASFPREVPQEYRWLTLSQVKRFIGFSNHFDVEARTLVSCLQSLWGREPSWTS
ncbi:NDP-hexose 2,3-dehydratase family protein [Streptomyces sp. NPDC026206]|uniref:NDP-hexose 2,3-dehydratase family protein n=1 Tax=Streptomyces sp. NPDC026206 TaxID=3157089 RepID=UPI0033F1ED7F